MDPDIPILSIEARDQNATTQVTNFEQFRDVANDRLESRSPSRTPFKTPLSHPATPATINSSSTPPIARNERLSTPRLQTKRSSSSLSTSRGPTPSKLHLRRVPSNLNSDSPPINMRSSDFPFVPPHTADAIARDCFQKELEAHADGKSNTIVIIHDSCYGHRFSRPRTSKTALSTIVERPERIHAILLGASIAYVRLGGRHADGAHGPYPGRDVRTITDRPFSFKKTTRIIPLDHPAVTHVHGTKWMEELQIMCDTAESKLALNGKELQRPIGYGKDENGNNLPKLHEGDLYLCSESLAALQGCLGGMCDAVDTVFSSSIVQRAFVCIRPPGHHCSSNFPSGFCWLNNVHVGISYAAMNHGLTHAAIIDFDLHHGDGSQTIAWEHNRDAQTLPKNAAQHRKTPIGYYSLHDINSYPCEWGDEDKVRNASLCIENAHGQSIWNVHLEPWKSLDHFWQLYESKYSILLEKTKVFLQHHSERVRASGVQPRAAIFLSAGFDASQWESQGMQRHNVNVPTEFYAKLTADVVKLAADPAMGVDGRVISVLEGGYSDRALASGVLSHLCGLTSKDNQNTSATELNRPYDEVDITSTAMNRNFVASASYETDWWTETNLEALESRVAGNVVVPLKKKDKAPGNYSSPTQSSTARMTDGARERNSLSSQLESRFYFEHAEPEPSQPVDWITASYELSRLLIPSDRQTLSYRHDELNAEATKVRRDRQSIIGVAAPVEKRMQLRTRGKGPIVESEPLRVSSRTSNRRTTIAAVSELPDPSLPLPRPRRRSSAGSSILSSFQDMKLEGNGTDNAMPASSRVTPTGLESTKDMVAKKTRMAPPVKKVSPKTSSPRKARASAISKPRTSASKDDLSSAQAQTEPMDVQAAPSPMHTGEAEVELQDDIDSLTNGMKKVSIKLKMPTLQQHTENQKQTEEPKIKKPRVIRKPPVPKVTKSKASPSVPPSNVTGVTAEAAVSPVSPDQPPVPIKVVTNSGTADGPPVGIESARVMEVKADARRATSMEMPHGVVSDVVDVLGGRENIGPAANQLSPQQSSEMSEASSHAMTADGSTQPVVYPTWKKTKDDLPIFTSSSPIPFGQKHASVKEEKGET